MNAIQRAAHHVVRSVANDLRENTLTNLVSIPLGAVGRGAAAYKAATSGFTMLERKVLPKTVAGAAKGAVEGWIGGKVALTVAQKLASVEKWFDNTKVGKAIDNGITKIENGLHKLIGGGYS
ncbi:hypothetical protein [Calditerricola satsumensis]|uniref:Uncharacterized protein n=1 Tax=Calditerricola satsumensis TaxID=373054 RepID=A0A8J3B684_9BACI|nr:hypothetical protein [Calditerricola satsumensis]GGJ92604.1 hypothetical protein GCM10007043_02840 [Calditerricola satsumensis]